MATNDKKSGGQLDPEALKAVKELTQQIAEHVGDTTEDFRQQAQIIAGLRDSFSKMADSIGASASGMQSMSAEQVNQINEATKKAAGELTQFEKAAKKAADSLGLKFVRGATLAVGLLTGLRQGFKNFYATLKVGFGVLTSAASGIYSVGKAILAIPLGIFKKFIEMADSGGGGNELFTAYEKVREEFGAFSSITSSTIISTTKNMMGMSEGGLHSIRVFGNMAEIMQKVTALAKAMGPQFTNNADEFMSNGKAILYYQKGLGIADDQMAAISIRAGLMGETITKQLNDMTKQSYALAKAFGLDAKVISKDMAKAMTDVAHFGHLSQKELAVATAYSNKLGVSIDKLTGLMDKFDTFDAAAESAASLGEQFGVNIDSMELMSAQDPAKKLEILRKAFMATGKDLSKLSYQERKFIQQQTGLDAATFDATMSQKNAAVSLDSMAKAGEKAATSQMTQTEALKQLASATERLSQSGSGAKGFFGKLADGFKRGLENSKEFRKITENINKIFVKFTEAGYKLGQMFVNTGPGMKNFLDGVAKIFDPTRYGKMLDRVVALFDKFSKRTGGVTENFKDFMQELKTIFFDFFNDGKPAGKQFLEGFKKFWLFVGKTIWSGIKWVWGELGKAYDKLYAELANPSAGTKAAIDGVKGFMQKVADFITNKAVPFIEKAVVGLTEWLRDPKKSILPTGTGNKFIDTLLEIVKPLGDALSNAFWKLLPKVKELVYEFISHIPGWMADAWMEAPWYVKLYTAFPVVSNILGGVFSQMMQQRAIKAAVSGALEKTITQGVSEGAASAASGLEAGAAKQGASFAQKYFPSFTNAFSSIGGKLAGAGSSISGLLGSSVGGGGAAAAGGGAAGAGVAATVVLPLIAGALSYAGTKYLLEKGGELADENAAELSKNVEQLQRENAKKIAELADPRKKVEALEAEFKKYEGLERGQQGLFTKGWNMVFGSGVKDEVTYEVAKKDAERRLAKAKQEVLEQTAGTNEFMAKQAKMQKEAAEKLKADQDKANKEEAERRLEQIGPVTIENATERFKKIDDLAKQVMSKDFDLQGKLTDIKKKLDGVNWGIISEDKEKELNTAFLNLQKVQGVMASIADIGGIVKVAGDKLKGMGDAFAKASPAATAIAHDGPIASLAKTITEETFKDVKLEDMKIAEGKMQGVLDIFNKIKSLVDDITSVKASFDKINFGTEFSFKVGEISKVFGVLTTATDTMSKMKSVASGTGEIDIQLHKTMGQIASFFWKLISEPYGDSTMGPLTSIIWSMNAIGQLLMGQKVTWKGKELGADLKGMNASAAATGVSNFTKSVSDIATNISAAASVKMPTNVAESFANISDAMSKFIIKDASGRNIFGVIADVTAAAQGYSPDTSKKAFNDMKITLKAAEELIAQVNSLNATLAGEGANPLKIKSVLTNLANNVGLGAGGKYEIKNRDVTIKVDLLVVMDAAKVENAIIQRRESVIRDKINVLADAAGASKTGSDLSSNDPNKPGPTTHINLYGPNTYSDSKYNK